MSDEERTLISDYLLAELPPEQRREAERRIREDPSFARRVERLRSVTTALTELPADAWPEPPATTGEEAERAGKAERQPSERVARPRRRSRAPGSARGRVMALVAVGAACLGIGIAVGTQLGTSTERGAATVTFEALRSVDARDAASASMSAGRMTLTVTHLPPLGASRFYELWLMSSTTKLVAVASFRVDASGHADLSVPLPVPAQDYRYLDISVQTPSRGPQHSGDSVLRAATRT
ncbi:MAG TPA: anti-sigma factor [Solirubrobacteraceae bacterium]|nr:anti-sigma factor [Solirubrobacteraceae bacterium]